MADRRGRLLLVTLEAARLDADVPVLWALRSWLDSWRGIGAVERGMERQGFDLQLTRYDERGWRATFYTTGMKHSPTSATGSAWEPTPWRAVQGAARDALRRGETRRGGRHEWHCSLSLHATGRTVGARDSAVENQCRSRSLERLSG